MIRLSAGAALFDVEGTTSSVSYVYDVMFPFARRELERFVRQTWSEASLDSLKQQFARDAGHSGSDEWLASVDDSADDPAGVLIDEANRLMDADVKATGLKQLQGMIWKAGFESGELRSHLFEEVADALRGFHAAGVDLRIYSSGSVQAQRLFFAHTEHGDLSSLFSGHYDTTTGPKRKAGSYTAIAADWGLPAEQIAFFSDVTEELDAARAAGLRTVLVHRPGNATPTPTTPPHDEISSFDEIEWRPAPA
ncbi:MAG: acireductone synthase [Planctomycetota bacterium]